METERFIVIVIPPTREKAVLSELGKRILACVQERQVEAPHVVHGDVDRLCFLMRGKLDTISKALDDALTSDTSWLAVQAGTAFEARGLSRSLLWLRRPS